MGRNPDRSREELILALDLYFRGDRTQLSKTHPEVLKLSELFRKLNISPFREPGSINMKLGNFVAIDPDSPNKGLDHGNPDGLHKGTDYRIWIEFSERPEYLLQVTGALKALSEESVVSELNKPANPMDMADEDEFPEGKILTRVHKFKERNPEAVQKKKEASLTAAGRLMCEVCRFDFVEYFGEIGIGFAECHHKIPLANLKSTTRTRISDLAIVCANCHRMLHKRPFPTIEQLTKMVVDNRTYRKSLDKCY